MNGIKAYNKIQVGEKNVHLLHQFKTKGNHFLCLDKGKNILQDSFQLHRLPINFFSFPTTQCTIEGLCEINWKFKTICIFFSFSLTMYFQTYFFLRF